MKEDTIQIDPTWMKKTGGYAKDMTLRDHFAALAMQGAISGCAAKGETFMYSDLVGLAYEMADAMLKERNK